MASWPVETVELGGKFYNSTLSNHGSMRFDATKEKNDANFTIKEMIMRK